MKTCRDCLHNDFCNVDGYIDADDCTFFQNKADFVEVVRCENCKFYKPQKQSAKWENKKKYCCRSASKKVNENDFCSYGEKE